MMRAGAFVTALALVSSLPSPGCAQTPSSVSPQAAPDAPPAQRRWYGWQTIVSFAAFSAITGATMAFRGGEAARIPGVAGIVLGGPVVHWAHGHGLRGFASLGIHVGAPVVLGLATLGLTCAAAYCRSFEATVAAGVGLVGAVALDVALLAYDDPPAAPVRRAGAWAAPNVTVFAGGAAIGAAGAF